MRFFKAVLIIALVGALCVGCVGQVTTETTGTVGTEPVITEPSLPTASDVTERPTEPAVTEPPATEPTVPEGPSLLDFLKIAAEPVGSTMYIWGGGWNEDDTGAGIEAVTLGVSSQWAAFAADQDSSYDYKDHRYQIHDGLDCSGYVGWAVYNTVETENGRPGYVGKSSKMAQELADRGLGDFIPASEMEQWLPGDIMSMPGHVWISLGMCGDGSVLLVHASPPGVIFCGTSLPDGSDSQAVELARQVMEEHYPDWYAKYPRCDRGYSYLEESSAMRWGEVLSDEEGLREMTAEEVVEVLFS